MSGSQREHQLFVQSESGDAGSGRECHFDVDGGDDGGGGNRKLYRDGGGQLRLTDPKCSVHAGGE